METNIPPLKDWLDLVTCVLHEEDTAEGKVYEGKVCDVLMPGHKRHCGFHLVLSWTVCYWGHPVMRTLKQPM